MPVDAERLLILGLKMGRLDSILFKSQEVYTRALYWANSIGSCSLAPDSTHSLSPQCGSQLPGTLSVLPPLCLLVWTMSLLGS